MLPVMCFWSCCFCCFPNLQKCCCFCFVLGFFTIYIIKKHWTLLLIVKDQSSYLVYLNMSIQLQTCENLSSIGRRSCGITMKEETPLSHEVVCVQMIWRPQILNLRFRNQIRGKLLLYFENYVTSEGPVSHNVLYYQHLPITRYQERFYVNNYFE